MTREGTIEVRGFHPPVQDRSRETLDRIVDATSRLLGRSSFDELSVDELVREANSSKGAFYARFDDKEALFSYLYEYWAERGKEIWRGFFSDPARRDETLPDLIRGIVGQLVEIYRTDPDCIRAFAIRARMPEDAVARNRAADLNEFVMGLVETSIARHGEAVGHPDPTAAARFGLIAVAAVAREFVLFGNERLRHEEMDDAGLVRELSSMYAAYLRVDPDPFTAP